jgi:hypothetical protein
VNPVIESLFSLVKDYFDRVSSGGAECRVVVPGVTRQVATLLHERLLDGGLPSFLVISLDMGDPDQATRTMYAPALTSVRQGPMIIVTSPGELANIQDSVVGSGGAVRSFAFSDEWPWVDDGSEIFRFDGPFLARLAAHWTSQPIDQEWLSQTILSIVKASAGNIHRANLLFDELLGKFSDRHYPSLPTLRHRFLFHCGIAMPDAITASNEAWGEQLEKLESLGNSVLDAYGHVGQRQEVLARAEELVISDPPALMRLQRQVNDMLDALSQGENTSLPGVLALRGSWNSEKDWLEIDIVQIKQLFSIPDRELYKLAVSVALSFGPIAENGKECILFEGGELLIECRYIGIPPGQEKEHSLVLVQRTKELGRAICNAEDRQADWVVGFEDIFGESDSKKIIRAQLRRGSEVMDEAKLTVHPCSTKSPFLAILEPGFHLLSSSESEDEVEKIVTATASRLAVCQHVDEGNLSILFDDQPVEAKAGTSDCRHQIASRLIDPSESPTGQIRVEILRGDSLITIDVEARDSDKGEFSIEREFVIQLSQGNRSKVEKLIDIFSGSQKTAYPSLGLNDQTRIRTEFANAFERPLENYNESLPILANFTSLESPKLVREGLLLCESQTELGALKGVQLGDDIQPVLTKYLTSRRHVVASMLKAGYSQDTRWPIYAFVPLFVHEFSAEQERIISSYLDAYYDVLRFLDSHKSSLAWPQSFVLSYLDCVVNWSPDIAATTYILLGPWHPLMVAKRFMAQSALLASARRFKNTDDSYRFHRLAILLDQLSCIRRVPLLNTVSGGLDVGFASPTSDSGWLFAMGADAFGTNQLLGIQRALRVKWGLEVGPTSSSREQMATSYMRDFCLAYPSRRALSVLADREYAAQRIVESAESLLYKADGSPTPLGEQLPGGVHLYLSHTDEIEELPWRSPSICVYDSGSAVDSDAFNDLRILPLAVPKGIQPGEESVPISRGNGMFSILTASARRIAKGASGVPVSSACELDLIGRFEPDLGSKFVNILSTIIRMVGHQGRVGWGLEHPLDVQHIWYVLPGSHADPAAFVEYVEDGKRRGQVRALWDYTLSVTGALNSYFIISLVPNGIRSALNASPVFQGKDVADSLIAELGGIGIAIGNESLRSGNRALGVVGVIAAKRMFLPSDKEDSPFTSANDDCGFLLPVDSFRELLGSHLEQPGSSKQRADLLAVNLSIDPARDRMQISYCSIECKYSQNIVSAETVSSAFGQARATYLRFHALAEIARLPSGAPERLALAALIGFGLRLSKNKSAPSDLLEQRVLDYLLMGKFEVRAARADSVVVVTDADGTSSEIVKRSEGWLLRLCTGHWPEINVSNALQEVKGQFRTLFHRDPRPLPSTPVGLQNTEPPLPAISERSGREIAEREAPENNVPSQAKAAVEITAPAAVSNLSRLKPVLLGTSENNRRVYFDPQSAENPLENYNIMITGSSGKGKTQLIKSIVCAMRDQGRDVTMLDFKNDFASDQHFVTVAKLDCRFITFDGLPYNPLIPDRLKHHGTGKFFVQTSQHLSGIASVLARTFGLGIQQEHALKDAMRMCYQNRGLDPTRTIEYSGTLEYPDFNDVGAKLRELDPRAYNRMDPLFDLNVFPSEFRQQGFESLISGSRVLDLSQIQSDPIKNAIAKIVILSAHAYYNAREHSGVLKQFFVFDEAHRVLDSEFLVRFVRECRAYGVGVLLSSQNPKDFPQEVAASLATKLVHGNGADKEPVRDIQNLLGLPASDGRVEAMGLFDAFASNSHHRANLIKTFGYPHSLVLDAIASDEFDGVRVDGLVEGRLTVQYLLDRLISMGLVEEVNGRYEASRVE